MQSVAATFALAFILASAVAWLFSPRAKAAAETPPTDDEVLEQLRGAHAEFLEAVEAVKARGLKIESAEGFNYRIYKDLG